MLRLGSTRRRLTIGFVTVAVLVLVLGGRLVQLQGLDGTRYAAAAKKDRTLSKELQSQRGKITDANGNILAYSVEAQAIYANPKRVKDPVQTALALAPVLKLPAGQIEALLLKPKSSFVYLAHGLDPSVGQQITDLALPGIFALPESKRLHPAGTVGANVVGFTNIDGVGQAGIERADDTTLTGTPGKLSAMLSSTGDIIPSGIHKDDPAVAGSNIELSLDSDLQYYTQTALNAALKATGAADGQVTVLDLQGHVKAMAAGPTYDASDPGKTPNRLGNPNVSTYFEPGSVNKVVTFAAALDKGLINPRTVFDVPDTMQVADRTIHDDWAHDPVKWTAAGILAKSSNIGTLMIANKLGPAAFMDYAEKFGEGQRTGIGLPAESSGSLPAMKNWSGSTFGNLPIGQGVAVTSLQLASMYQAIANNGVRIPPRIIDSITGPGGNTSTPAKSQPTRVMSAKTAATLRDMLQMVTQPGGTATKAAIPGYTVAGKTGTGQKLNAACGCYSDSQYWSTFAGMAPADSPKYIISVMVDSPKTDYMGGDVAAPLFHQVMSYALKHGGVPPTGAAPAALPILGR